MCMELAILEMPPDVARCLNRPFKKKYVMGSTKPYSKSLKTTDNLEKTYLIFTGCANCAVKTVSADGLARLGARTSTGTVITKFA